MSAISYFNKVRTVTLAQRDVSLKQISQLDIPNTIVQPIIQKLGQTGILKKQLGSEG